MPAYPNRTDIAVSTPKSKSYGDATASRQAQQAVPMGNPAPVPVARPSAPRRSLIPLDAPTQAPGEPITAGANFGAGPNSTGAGLPPPVGAKDDLSLRLRAIASQFPSAALLGLIAELESQ